MRLLKDLYWRWQWRRIDGEFKDQRVPIYSKKFGVWGVDLGDRIETGDMAYVLSEFSASGVVYRYHNKFMNDRNWHDHDHSFTGVLRSLVDDPEAFSYQDFETDYSAQQRAFLDAIQRKLLTKSTMTRWQNFALPELVTGMALSLYDDSLTVMSAYRDTYVGFQQINPPFKWYRHDHILILPIPTPDQVREQHKVVQAFGQTISVVGEQVFFLHVDDWETTPVVVGAMSTAETNDVRAHVTINGVGNLQPRKPQPLFLDQHQ